MSSPLQRTETPQGIDMRIPDSPIVQTYALGTAGSARIHARAARVLAGGNSRQVSYWHPHPLTITKADGAHLYDIDGQAYIDLTNNYSALVHGHCFPPVVEAVKQQVGSGTAWSAQNEAQVELAELLVDRIPSMDRIRFTNSGTEAFNLALSIARVATGRNKILMARFGYHGSMMESESGSFDHPAPGTTLVADYNDAESFERVLDQHGSEVAAVFLEPVLGSAGIVPAEPDFVRRVAAAARRAGALFVLDEVITLRLGYGGQQAEIGVKPDLTMLGKLIGGGFPVGAVGGSAELMALFDPSNLRAWHSGTFNGNPVTMKAGAVAVAALSRAEIDRMAAMGLQLKEGLELAAERAGLPCSVNLAGSLLNVFFCKEAPRAALLREDQAAITKFHLACLNHGLFTASRGLMVLSTAMNQALVGEIIERASCAMANVAGEL